MADCSTSLFVKKVETEEFKKWFKKESSSWTNYDSAEDWDLYVEIEGGYGGYFWESLALKMANSFKGIVFEGDNQVVWDDHLIRTSFESNGEEITLTRCIELPSDFDDEIDEEYAEEIENMRAIWELENDIPYLVKFSVEDVVGCFKVYEAVEKKLKDGALVEATCTEHKISKERFMEFVNILNFKKRC